MVNINLRNKSMLKSVISVLFVIIILLGIIHFFRYKKIVGMAKGEVGETLALNLPHYVSMHNITYTIRNNSRGYVVSLSGNITGTERRVSTLFARVQFNYFVSNPKITMMKVARKKFQSSKWDYYYYKNNRDVYWDDD